MTKALITGITQREIKTFVTRKITRALARINLVMCISQGSGLAAA